MNKEYKKQLVNMCQQLIAEHEPVRTLRSKDKLCALQVAKTVFNRLNRLQEIVQFFYKERETPDLENRAQKEVSTLGMLP